MTNKYRKIKENESRDVTIKRFMKKVIKADNGCWIWKYSKCPKSYGGFSFWENGTTKKYTAHRASYMLFKGNIPEGLLVRHLCHNKHCVNPDHLKVGTQKENARDNLSNPIFWVHRPWKKYRTQQE